MKSLVAILLLSLTTTAQAQVAAKGLILDLDADKGVEVEEGNRVVQWTNQVTTFRARDFVKQDQGRKEAGSGRPTLKKSAAASGQICDASRSRRTGGLPGNGRAR